MQLLKKISIQFVLFFLRFGAKVQLLKIKPKIIGIGGSSGKSSLCDLVSLTLGIKYKVKQGGGKNSETGLPLDILDIAPGEYTIFDWVRIILLVPYRLVFNWQKYDFYIAEMGIDGPFEPKNMSYLLKIIKPEVAVLTNISLEHSVYFDFLVKEQDFKEREEKLLKLIADQELMLIKSISKNGTTIINLDDDFIKKSIADIESKKITVSSHDNKADFYIQNIKSSLDNFAFQLRNEKNTYSVNINRPLPSHFAYSIAVSFAIALEFEINTNDVLKILQSSITLPPGRMSMFKGIKNTTLIDSSYNNATLTPIMDILSFLKSTSNGKRKVAIIGDMRELGTMSKNMHEIVAKKIAETADLAILIGPMMGKFAAPILKKSKTDFASFENFTSSKDFILKNIKPNDTILVKSSQNKLFLERVVEMLLADKKDVGKLCRRGSFWDKKRQESL